MTKPMSPCKGCTTETGRSVTPNCHSTCEKFLKFRKELDEWNVGQKKRTLTDAMVNEQLCTRYKRFK